MPIHVLVTGPIRPSLEGVLNLHSQAKRYFPGCVTHLVYWSTTDSDHATLTKTFDHVNTYPEPSQSFIDSVAPVPTMQHRQEPGRLKQAHYNTYKQALGAGYMTQKTNITDSEVVVRLRTDAYLFDVNDQALSSFIDEMSPSVYYTIPRPVSSGNGICDSFAISTFGVYKKVWGMDNATYSAVCAKSWNPENMVRSYMEMINVPSGDIPPNAIRYAVCRQYCWATHLLVLS
jgi:hypothetical protein